RRPHADRPALRAHPVSIPGGAPVSPDEAGRQAREGHAGPEGRRGEDRPARRTGGLSRAWTTSAPYRREQGRAVLADWPLTQAARRARPASGPGRDRVGAEDRRRAGVRLHLAGAWLGFRSRSPAAPGRGPGGKAGGDGGRRRRTPPPG